MGALQKCLLQAKGWVLLLTIVFSGAITGSAFAQDKFSTLRDKVSTSFYNSNVATVLQYLQQQTSYTFSFDNTAMQLVYVDSLVIKEGTLGVALQILHDKAGILFQVMPNKNIGVQKGKAPVKDIHVTGQILDQKTGLPVVGATVIVGKARLTTDIEGKYSVELKPGKYEVEVSFIGYQGKRITDLVAGNDEIMNMDVALTPETGTLSGVMVSAGMRKESVAALYVKQKNSVAISDGISAEQIRVTADNNAAQVLKRVSGVVVQNDKFVTIRGVSDRYNNVLINGAMLPSTEPNRRNFSFDIVPSALIDNIVITKTATPDMSGEFSGGVVQINTRDVPVKNFLTVTVGSGFNTASSGLQMKDTRRYNSDYFAAKGEERKWFRTLLNPKDYVAAVYKNDKAYMGKVGASIPNRWAYYNYPYAPVQNYQLGGGMLFRLKQNRTAGFTAGVTYRNEQTAETGSKKNLANSTFETERYKFVTTLGALLNAAYKTQHHRFAVKNLYNRRFNSQFDYDLGTDFNTVTSVRNTSSNLLISEILQNRIEGEHVIGQNKLRVDWYVDRNVLTREQPDTRYLRGDLYSGVYNYDFKEPLMVRGALFASELKETRKNAGINISLPFRLLDNAQQVKAGYAYSYRDVLYNGSGFRILDRGDGEWSGRGTGLSYDQIVTADKFASQQFYYAPTYFSANTTGDGYGGDQRLHAGYLMADLHLMPELRVTGGMRLEKNNVNLQTQYFMESMLDSSSTGAIPTETAWLPSLNVTYSATPKVNFRVAYGETLARPDFVERTPFIYYDFPEQVYVSGTYAIKTTRVKNYDVRAEFYPSANEVASVSFFYKDFTDPVERFFVLGNPSNAVVYSNLDKANVKGVEIDFRKSLSFISDGAFLRNLYLSGNFSYLKGNIETYASRYDSATQEIKRVKIQSNRPVQGLAPYVVNMGLNYQSKMLGFNMSYNRFGRRIVYGGTFDQYVQYEVPRDIVDLQISFQMMRQRLELRLNASDILNQPFVIYSNSTNDKNGGSGTMNDDPKGKGYNADIDFINYRVKKGANYSFTITYKL